MKRKNPSIFLCCTFPPEAVPSVKAQNLMKFRVDLQTFSLTVMATVPAASGHLYLHMVSFRGTSQAALSYRISTRPQMLEKVGIEGQSMSKARAKPLNTLPKYHWLNQSVSLSNFQH